MDIRDPEVREDELQKLHKDYQQKIHGLIAERDSLRTEVRQQREELEQWGGDHRRQMLRYKQGLAATLEILEKEKTFLYGEEDLPGEQLPAVRERLLEPDLSVGVRILFFFYQILLALFVAVAHLRIRDAEHRAEQAADAQISELTRQLQAQKATFQDQEKQLLEQSNRLRQRLAQESSQSAQHQDEIKRLQRELAQQSECVRQVHALEKTLREQTGQVKQYEQQMTGLRRELEQKAGQMKQYERQTKELQTEVQRMLEERRGQMETIAGLKRELERVNQEVSRTAAKLRRARGLLWVIGIAAVLLVVAAAAAGL